MAYLNDDYNVETVMQLCCIMGFHFHVQLMCPLTLYNYRPMYTINRTGLNELCLRLCPPLWRICPCHIHSMNTDE